MRIAYLISHLRHTGPVNVLYELVKGLLDERLCLPEDVWIVTLSPERQGSRRADFQGFGVQLRCVPVRARGIAAGAWAVRRLLGEIEPDVCHSHCVKADGILAVASIGLDVGRVSTVHNIPEEDLRFAYPGIRGRLAARLHYTSLKLLRSRLVGCSATVAAHLRRVVQADARTVRNPVAPPVISSWARPHDARRLVSAASIDERKNTRALLDRFTGSARCAQLELAVFGEGPLRAELMSRYPDPRIAWPGYSTRLGDELRASAAYVSTSRSEGMPLTPLQALLCGAPCVLSDIPQHREISALSRRVFLFDPGSQASFDEAVDKALAADEPARPELEALAHRLSPAAAARSYMAIYEDAVRARPARVAA